MLHPAAHPLLAGPTRHAHALLARPAARQLVRYIIGGLFVTQLAALIYSLLVLQHVSPFAANVGSTGCGLLIGYTIHSRWSFKGGRKDSEGLQLGRFLTASAVAFAINNFWIWLTVQHLAMPPLAPVPLMMLATPVMSFLLNRYWVFKAHCSPGVVVCTAQFAACLRSVSHPRPSCLRKEAQMYHSKIEIPAPNFVSADPGTSERAENGDSMLRSQCAPCR